MQGFPDRPAVQLGDPRVRFFGQFSHRLDARQRLALPPRLRAAIGEAELKRGLILTRGFDGCIWLFPQTAWEAAVGDLCRSCFSGQDARMFERLFVGGAVEVRVDRQGRIELPAGLRERAGIDGEALFVGIGARIEIWGKARWQAMQVQAEPRLEEIGEALGRGR